METPKKQTKQKQKNKPQTCDALWWKHNVDQNESTPGFQCGTAQKVHVIIIYTFIVLFWRTKMDLCAIMFKTIIFNTVHHCSTSSLEGTLVKKTQFALWGKKSKEIWLYFSRFMRVIHFPLMQLYWNVLEFDQGYSRELSLDTGIYWGLSRV